MSDALLVVAALGILSASTCVFAQRSSFAEESCAGAAGHAENRRCLEGWAEVSLNSLVAAEKQSRSHLAKADEVAGDIARALTAFDDAAQAYRIYREKQCNYVASLAFGGNGAEDRRLLCQIELDRRRAANLRKESQSGPK